MKTKEAESKTRTLSGALQSIIQRMQRENATICEYCGAQKEGLSFSIGASLQPSWIMVEGTGKMACPNCWEKATKEGKAIIDKL